MKKIQLLSLLLVSLVLFACEYIGEPAQHTYYYEDLAESVISIELINYNNPDAKTIRGKPDIFMPFDFDKMEIIEVLPEAKHEDFLKQFSDYSYWYFDKHLDSPKGLGIRLIHKNGNFDLVCRSNYSALFDKNGIVIKFIGSGLDHSFTDFTNKYFDTKF